MAEEKFTIGGYTFDSFYEYRNAQEDVRKIECINEELDVQDPKVAIRLYSDIREGKIRFYSPIGKQFVDHIGDIVATSSVEMLGDRDVIEEANEQVRNQKILGLALVVAAFVVLGVFVGGQIRENMETQRIKELQQQVAANGPANVPGPITNTQATTSEYGAIAHDPDIDVSTLTILPQYQQLYEQNQDFVGWLNVVDTDINYPVMQTKENDYFYLNRSFDKKEDANGTLFVDYRADIVNQSVNTIIYGHNMKSGSMFGGLKQYLDYDYFNSHLTILFNTLYEEREYEIIAVGLSQVSTADSDEYKYYNFIDTDSAEDLSTFLSSIHSMSVHENNFNVTNSDKLLTLSTCNSYTDDGRLFIVAKRVK